MTSDTSPRPVSPLRARMIEDMTVRGFKEDTRRDYVRHVRAFAAFIGRSPDTATAEELRLFQLHQMQSGVQPPGINSAVSALRFFFHGDAGSAGSGAPAHGRAAPAAAAGGAQRRGGHAAASGGTRTEVRDRARPRIQRRAARFQGGDPRNQSEESKPISAH